MREFDSVRYLPTVADPDHQSLVHEGPVQERRPAQHLRRQGGCGENLGKPLELQHQRLVPFFFVTAEDRYDTGEAQIKSARRGRERVRDNLTSSTFFF